MDDKLAGEAAKPRSLDEVNESLLVLRIQLARGDCLNPVKKHFGEKNSGDIIDVGPA